VNRERESTGARERKSRDPSNSLRAGFGNEGTKRQGIANREKGIEKRRPRVDSSAGEIVDCSSIME
jgi:hypothetical protein